MMSSSVLNFDISRLFDVKFPKKKPRDHHSRVLMNFDYFSAGSSFLLQCFNVPRHSGMNSLTAGGAHYIVISRYVNTFLWRKEQGAWEHELSSALLVSEDCFCDAKLVL